VTAPNEAAATDPLPAAAQRPRTLAGHNRIGTQAMSTVARAAAAQTFGVGPSDVRVAFSDDGGLLAMSLALPVGIPPLGAVVRDPGLPAAEGGTIMERATAAKGAIGATFSGLTGARLSRVDIRINGTRALVPERVR
jgi:hypothetical protein